MSAKPIQSVDSRKVEPTILRDGFLESRRLITKAQQGSTGFSMSLVRIKPGWDYVINHPDKDEALYMLEGEAHITAGAVSLHLVPGTAAYLPAGSEYRYQSGKAPNVLIAVLSPPAA